MDRAEQDAEEGCLFLSTVSLGASWVTRLSFFDNVNHFYSPFNSTRVWEETMDDVMD